MWTGTRPRPMQTGSGLRRPLFVVLIALLASPALAGCLGNEATKAVDTAADGLVPVEDRWELEWDTSGPYSRVLVNGTHGIDAVRGVFVDVDLPASEGGAALTGDAAVHLGLWLPVIEGCDWEATDLPEACHVPVIADVGPYYDDGDVDALTPANRLGAFLIENYVPHGYAVAQVSVFGTGESNHCMDLMGTSEQLGIDAAVTWLGEQDWSNGRVGLIGKSYDGSTPWQAAMFGNPHLATIVPLSGLIGVRDLMWRNGSMEARGMVMHNGVYGSFGIDGDTSDAQTACRGYAEGYANGPAAYLSGDDVNILGNDYWTSRHFLTRVLANHQGSVYIIQGMQDWNVDPHMAFPTYQLLQEAGIPVRCLAGQWAHDYPDRLQDHTSMPSGKGAEALPYTARHDWAQDLLEWFESELAQRGPQPPLHCEIQDNMGGWRVEPTYPPEDASILAIRGSDMQVSGGTTVSPTSGTIRMVTEPFDEDTRIVGMPAFHVPATVSGTSGHLFVRMLDAETGLRLGHAVMDLRYHAGGYDRDDLFPGETVVAKMEFMPMDVVVPAGHGIELVITHSGEDYTPSPPALASATLDLGQEAGLLLPLVDRSAEDLFWPAGHERA